MNSRLHDMLMLVSRVQEKRGDIRFMVRQDPSVQQDVHAYLDDLQWLTRVRTPAPARGSTAAGKELLLLQLERSRRRQFVPARILGVAVTLGLLMAIVATNPEASRTVPQPVDQKIDAFFFSDEGQVQASPLSYGLSTPAEAALEAAGPAFTR